MPFSFRRFFDENVRLTEGFPQCKSLLSFGKCNGRWEGGQRTVEIVPVGTHLAPQPGACGDPAEEKLIRSKSVNKTSDGFVFTVSKIS